MALLPLPELAQQAIIRLIQTALDRHRSRSTLELSILERLAPTLSVSDAKPTDMQRKGGILIVAKPPQLIEFVCEYYVYAYRSAVVAAADRPPPRLSD